MKKLPKNQQLFYKNPTLYLYGIEKYLLQKSHIYSIQLLHNPVNKLHNSHLGTKGSARSFLKAQVHHLNNLVMQ